MGFFKALFGAREVRWRAALRHIQTKFSVFRCLLDLQNQVLKAISGWEEKSRRNRVLSTEKLAEIEQGVGVLIEKMIELGGDDYEVLRQRYQAIREDLENDLAAKPRAASSDFVISFDRLGRLGAHAVGTKNANLGELKSRLGLPIPDGFAISTRACRHFVNCNHLHERIRGLLQEPASAARTSDLDSLSAAITSWMVSSPVPEDLQAAIERHYDDLARRCPEERFAMRSSAVDEDTAFTFAGQYVSFLNVRKGDLLDCYKKVLASQFTPAALRQFMMRGLAEADLAMGVGCMAFVDAAASGVVYTRDPLNADGDYVLVNAVLGLGSYLVEGVLTPDVFHVSRQDRTVLFSRVARKPVQLVMLPCGGVGEQAVPEPEQEQAAIAVEPLRLLAEYALKVEAHYGAPQDIEWAIDRRGRLFLLQTRPLRVIKRKAAAPVPAELSAKRIAGKGTPICPGAGGGPVFHLRSVADLDQVPEGVVLVAQNPSPKLIAVMQKVSALVTEVGGVASHMATLAREAWIPTVAGVSDVSRLPPGLLVTVDATDGVLYEGLQADLIASRRAECEAPDPGRLPESLRRVLETISHLNLINPGAPDFRPDHCRTLHDIIRFIHQKAMEEMFLAAKRTAYKDRIGQRLKTKIPLLVNIIHLEQEIPGRKDKSWIAEDAIDSVPMRALWSGVLEEGWPSRPVAPDLRGFLAVMGTNISQGNQPEFSESSYAFLSREYMLLNLRMGYHFATIEALVTPDPIKNYIRMQYKEGGAPLERRIRRIRLICKLLTRMGFEHSCQGDFLDATISYQDSSAMTRHLRLLGRINIITKQLDMALANDAVAQWYADDFAKKLGLGDAAINRL
jgi:pyruvate,water dikinase